MKLSKKIIKPAFAFMAMAVFSVPVSLQKLLNQRKKQKSLILMRMPMKMQSQIKLK